jgi:HEAT repeat protein
VGNGDEPNGATKSDQTWAEIRKLIESGRLKPEVKEIGASIIDEVTSVKGTGHRLLPFLQASLATASPKELSEAIKVIFLLSRVGDSTTECAAIESLGVLGAHKHILSPALEDELLDRLLNVLRDERTDLQHAALIALVQLRTTLRASQIPAGLITSPSADVRSAAVDLAHVFSGDEQASWILPFLSDKDQRIRSKAEALIRAYGAGETAEVR